MPTRLERTRVVAKTSAYTISRAVDRAGTLFTNRGAGGSVTFTLPTPNLAQKGDWYEFRVHADQSLIVAAASANTLHTIGDTAANNVGFQTSGVKVGRGILAVCDGTQWHAYPLGAFDGFCVDGSEVAFKIGGNTLSATELGFLDGVSAGTRTASKALVVGSDGSIDAFNVTKTLTDTAPATNRILHATLTLTPASAMAIAGGGSLAGVRGEIVMSASKSFTEGFFYGGQGKVTLNGILAEGAAARIAGLLGQVDLSTGTLTLGQVSALWGDLQGNPTLTVNDQLYCARLTNSMSAGKKAQAFQLMYGAADFLLEASADGGAADWLVVAAVGGSQSHKLKCQFMGTTYYIPLNTA